MMAIVLCIAAAIATGGFLIWNLMLVATNQARDGHNTHTQTHTRLLRADDDRVSG